MDKSELLFLISLIFFISIFLIYRIICDVWTSSRKNEIIRFIDSNSGEDVKIQECMQNKIINKYTYSEFKIFMDGFPQLMVFMSLPDYEPDELSKSFIADLIKFESECSKN